MRTADPATVGVEGGRAARAPGNGRPGLSAPAGYRLRVARVGALAEGGDGGLVAVWCDALFEVGERLGEADRLDVAREREGSLGGVACGIDLAALKVRDREP